MSVCVLEFAELDFAVPITDGSCFVSVWTSIVNLILQSYTMHVALRSRTNHFQNQHTSPTAWTSLATVFRFHILPNPQIEKKLTVFASKLPTIDPVRVVGVMLSRIVLRSPTLSVSSAAALFVSVFCLFFLAWVQVVTTSNHRDSPREKAGGAQDEERLPEGAKASLQD